MEKVLIDPVVQKWKQQQLIVTTLKKYMDTVMIAGITALIFLFLNVENFNLTIEK